eukprot:3582315-Rhodomonas_salina.1
MQPRGFPPFTDASSRMFLHSNDDTNRKRSRRRCSSRAARRRRCSSRRASATARSRLSRSCRAATATRFRSPRTASSASRTARWCAAALSDPCFWVR